MTTILSMDKDFFARNNKQYGYDVCRKHPISSRLKAFPCSLQLLCGTELLGCDAEVVTGWLCRQFGGLHAHGALRIPLPREWFLQKSTKCPSARSRLLHERGRRELGPPVWHQCTKGIGGMQRYGKPTTAEAGPAPVGVLHMIARTPDA